MTQCVEDVSFPRNIERRRPIHEILPTDINESANASSRRLKATSWLVVVTLLISVPLYMKFQTAPMTPAILRLSLGAAPLYAWYGFHRVSPEEGSLN